MARPCDVGPACALLLVGALLACDRPAPSTADPSPPQSEREQVLGPFLSAHWQLPIPPQGPIPPGWSPAEADLAPATCGACHPKQFAEWKTSFHAAAYSPGFAGQLVEGELAEPGALRHCQTCHTPLAEQQPVTETGAANPVYDPELRRQGLVCAGCHVRAHERRGPPRRPELAPLAPVLPHGGFEAHPEFQESRFCATCHQFFDDAGIDGVPIQNTYAEWRASPQAAAGRSCQSCHMPDRAHTWRGIHDPDMVRQGVDVALRDTQLADVLTTTLVVTNRDVGHAFPTYVTPRVFLSLYQEDADGNELADTRREATIGRPLAGAGQAFDTRVPPGESYALPYTEPRHPEARTLVARVTVAPDFHYEGVYAALLDTLTDPDARTQIADAARRAAASHYTLFEDRLPL
ncbi:MAG: hypothetical protein MJE66_25105 [Proteobacteria bacterium]|nr:hypothetical protein [Pseudomonadota bacterium]